MKRKEKKNQKSFAGVAWRFSWRPNPLTADAPLFSTPSVARHARVSFINTISANNNESVALKGQISFS